MSYTADEKKILRKYFTSVDTSIYGLINLPEVIKGSLFSRYSRTTKDVRRLFLDEFFNVAELKGMFGDGKDEGVKKTGVNVAKAEDFYERILVGYGDDSIAELGSAHIAVENISMLATKAIEEHRIGLSPLEKSTRYVYYDKKIDDEYLYVKPDKIMKSKYGKDYVRVINLLFDTYSKIVREIQPTLMKIFPGDPNEKAYKFSIRAKACDIVRGLLPLGAKTNMGVMGNGRAFEYLITHLLNDPLEEVQQMGREMYEGLAPTMNAFIKRSVNERGEKTRDFWKASDVGIKKLTKNYSGKNKVHTEHSAELVDFDKNAVVKILASVIFQQSELPYKKCLAEAKKLSPKKQEEMLAAFTGERKIRQHKPGRAAEDAYAAFEIVSDWGVYKDLMRHRMMTRHKQLFTNELGYYMPYEIKMTGFEDIYRNAMEEAAKLYTKMKVDLPQEAQYVVTHGSFCRFYLRANIRALSHMNELRSTPQGHPSYRKVVQDMTKALTKKLPLIGKHFFQFVDYNDYELERLDAFRKLEKKANKFGVKGFEE